MEQCEPLASHMAMAPRVFIHLCAPVYGQRCWLPRLTEWARNNLTPPRLTPLLVWRGRSKLLGFLPGAATLEARGAPRCGSLCARVPSTHGHLRREVCRRLARGGQHLNFYHDHTPDFCTAILAFPRLSPYW